MSSGPLLTLAPHVRKKLMKVGFHSLEDLASIKPTQLAREAGLSNEEALEVLNLARQGPADMPEAQSAYAILSQQHTQLPIVTFCQALDQILGGGLHVGSVTEFCGTPGIGKTQLGMQLALDVQIPEVFGGVAGSAIYIDTEGSFTVSRAREMAEALVKHLQDLCNSATRPATPEMRRAVEAMTVDHLLSNVMYYRVHDFVEQLALVNVLPSYIAANRDKRFRLVVLDSVAFHFRHDFVDLAQRARILQSLAQQLQSLAAQHSLAVVVTNQVTTKFKPTAEAYLTPALGESWAHAVTHRVMLYMDGNDRVAYLMKSPTHPNQKARFRILGRGVRDIPDRKRKMEIAEECPRDHEVSLPRV